MVTLYVNAIFLDVQKAIVGTVTDEKMLKENLSKILSKEELLVIVKELEKEPYTVSVFVPFKQFIARIQLSKISGQQKAMVFYNCKNDLSIAENICAEFDDWDDATKEIFMNTFYNVLANYNPDDLAELQVVT